MKQQGRAALLFLVLAVVAAAFRFPHLADRPMHCDEAVNADKLGTLLEQGRYEYSAVEFHGPSLYYLSLAAARAQGITRYVDLNEVTLRSVPALLGVLLVAAHFLLVPYLGLPAAACAGLFTAVSPAMVYYSRYYIHETLLVLLAFGALLSILAYGAQRSSARALAAGVCFGLMYATKETMILPAACILVALLATRLVAPTGLHLALAVGAGLLAAVILMSSFFTHPRGIIDSILAYGTYFHRGSGLDTQHVHPWYFYFARLLYFHTPGAPVFSEALIAALALGGLFVALPQAGIPRFLAIYTVLMVAVYSAIPYKAPWNILGFLHGMILLAGIAAGWMISRPRGLDFFTASHEAAQSEPRPSGSGLPSGLKLLTLAVLLAGVTQLGWQAHAASFQYAADPRNPWVYAHTGNDVFAITTQMEALAKASPEGRAMPVQIITRENLWPLPWYLRRFSGVRWWNGVSDTAPSAPVILATPDMEPALLHKLYDLPPPGQREMYVNLFDRYVELRPSVEVRLYVAKSLWDRLQEAQ